MTDQHNNPLSTPPRFYVSGGTLPRDAPSYIRRQADEDLYQSLQHGDLCYILTARQMGKSSLMVRTVFRLRAEGFMVAVLDLTLQGRHLSMEQWYDGLLRQVGRQCGIEDEIEAWRQANKTLSPLQRWVAGLRQVALPRLPGRIVIFIDEIDAVRSLPFPTDEFFAALRALYNARTEDPQVERLTFCVLGVASPADLIRDTRTTPFNIGRRIELTDFTSKEAAPLAEGLFHRLPDLTSNGEIQKQLERVLYWTGGHPYLTQRLCAIVAEAETASSIAGVDRLCATAFFTVQAHEQEDNLLFVRERLLRSEADRTDLLTLYARVAAGKRVPDDPADPLVSVLRLSGVVKSEDGRLRIRNRIYERVFDRRWISSSLPDADRKRQKAAYRRGQLRASLVAAALIAVISSLAIGAWQQARRAERGEGAALHAENRAKGKEADAEREAGRANRLAQQRASMVRLMQKARDTAQRETRIALAARQSARESAAKERAAKHAAQAAAASEARQRRIATTQTAVARAETLAARQDAYVAGITLAWQKLQYRPTDPVTALPTIRRLLEEQKPGPGQPDIRGFEWYYLDKLTHRKVLRIQAHKGRVWAVALSPDGKLLASAGDDGALRLWDAVHARPIATLHTGKERVIYVMFSPDGKTLASCGGDQVVRLWNMESHAPPIVLKGHTEEVNSVAFSPDCRQIVSASDDGTVRLWDARTGAPVQILLHCGEWLNSVAYSSDGTTIAVGCFKGRMHVWDVRAAREIYTFEGVLPSVNALGFCSDAHHLISAGRDNNATTWFLEADGPPAGGTIMKGHTDQITAMGISGHTLLTASSDSVARLWEGIRGYEIAVLHGYTKQLHGASLSRDGRLAVLGDDDGSIYLWDLAASREDAIFPGAAGDNLLAARFLPDGRLLAVTMNWTAPRSEPTICIRDVIENRPVACLHAALQEQPNCAISFDGTQVAFTGPSYIPMLWNAARGRVAPLPNAAHEGVYCLAFSHDGKRLAASCGHGSLQIWDTNSGAELKSLKGGNEPLRHVAFSEDGRLVAAVADRGRTWVWDLTDRRSPRVFEHTIRDLQMCSFSPDARCLATSGEDNIVDVWNLHTGQRRRIVTGQLGPIGGLAYSPDGRSLATLGGDGLVRLWNLSALQEMAVLPLTAPVPLNAVSNGVSNVPNGICAFSPDSRRLAAFTFTVGKLFETRPGNTKKPDENRSSISGKGRTSQATHRKRP